MGQALECLVLSVLGRWLRQCAEDPPSAVRSCRRRTGWGASEYRVCELENECMSWLVTQELVS